MQGAQAQPQMTQVVYATQPGMIDQRAYAAVHQAAPESHNPINPELKRKRKLEEGMNPHDQPLQKQPELKAQQLDIAAGQLPPGIPHSVPVVHPMGAHPGGPRPLMQAAGIPPPMMVEGQQQAPARKLKMMKANWWTQKQIEALLEAVEQHGNKWNHISKSVRVLKGKKGDALRMKYNSLIKTGVVKKLAPQLMAENAAKRTPAKDKDPEASKLAREERAKHREKKRKLRRSARVKAAATLDWHVVTDWHIVAKYAFKSFSSTPSKFRELRVQLTGTMDGVIPTLRKILHLDPPPIATINFSEILSESFKTWAERVSKESMEHLKIHGTEHQDDMRTVYELKSEDVKDDVSEIEEEMKKLFGRDLFFKWSLLRTTCMDIPDKNNVDQMWHYDHRKDLRRNKMTVLVNLTDETTVTKFDVGCWSDDHKVFIEPGQGVLYGGYKVADGTFDPPLEGKLGCLRSAVKLCGELVFKPEHLTSAVPPPVPDANEAEEGSSAPIQHTDNQINVPQVPNPNTESVPPAVPLAAQGLSALNNATATLAAASAPMQVQQVQVPVSVPMASVSMPGVQTSIQQVYGMPPEAGQEGGAPATGR